MARLEGPTSENYRKDSVYGQRIESHRVYAVRASAVDNDDEETTDSRYAGQSSECLSGAGRGRDLGVGWCMEGEGLPVPYDSKEHLTVGAGEGAWVPVLV